MLHEHLSRLKSPRSFPGLPCQRGTSFVPAWMFGDPHITTLDGTNYTFNGLGDFLLVRTRDRNSSFLLQGRTAQTGSAQATNFIAFAAEYNSSSLDPITVSGARALPSQGAFSSGTFSWRLRPWRRKRRKKGREQEGGRTHPASAVVQIRSLGLTHIHTTTYKVDHQQGPTI